MKLDARASIRISMPIFAIENFRKSILLNLVIKSVKPHSLLEYIPQYLLPTSTRISLLTWHGTDLENPAHSSSGLDHVCDLLVWVKRVFAFSTQLTLNTNWCQRAIMIVGLSGWFVWLLIRELIHLQSDWQQSI